MKLLNEEQILDEEFRKQVIQEILSPENMGRKKESFKRYEIYKDMAKKYVVEALRAEGLKDETVTQMANRAANISLCRKVINKLARTYSGGVVRETAKEEKEPVEPKKPAVENEAIAEVPEEQPVDPLAEVAEVEGPKEPELNGTDIQVSELARLLCFDEKMKKGDRYRELQKNMCFQVVPERVYGEEEMYRIVMRTLLPWQYDVIEDARDREQMRVVILSDFNQGDAAQVTTEANAAMHHSNVVQMRSNGRDETIADSPSDANQGSQMRFVWWSTKYHLTCDGNGKIVPTEGNENNENPIEMLPFVNNADDQDGQFWAQGGDDLIEGAILVNKIITDMNYIAYTQGWGQWVITGRNLDNKISMGPQNAMLLDYDPANGDPIPTATVVSANPPLGEWMRMIEQYIALLLTTNNLSPGNISMKLDANTFPSGVALMIEKSEATDDISDKQKSYKDIERQLWKRIVAWHNMYYEAQTLEPEFMEVGKVDGNMELAIKFNDLKPVVTETEKLNALKLRKDLGLNSEIDLIMMDNPDLTVQEAEKKLLQIKKGKLENMAAFGPPPGQIDPKAEKKEDDKPKPPFPPAA